MVAKQRGRRKKRKAAARLEETKNRAGGGRSKMDETSDGKKENEGAEF